jgi:6,7-dimethyl-8-ribityllumazine synthase
MGYKVVEGQLVATGKRFGVVVGRFNNFIGDRLLEGAVDCIVRHGGAIEDITVYKVPGTFELPLVVQKAAATGEHDAVIALGVLIRGATPHFDYIAAECTKGVAAVAQNSGVPVAFGVLTCNTIEQAIERAGTKSGNKGVEAALAAIEMADLVARI